MDKRGNIIEPVTLYYIKADQLVSTAQVKVEREEWGEI